MPHNQNGNLKLLLPTPKLTLLTGYNIILQKKKKKNSQRAQFQIKLSCFMGR